MTDRFSLRGRPLVVVLLSILLSLWAHEAWSQEGASEAKSAKTEEEYGFEQIEMLTHVIELIRQEYHDEDRVSYETLIDSALEGMLANLDPHCQFMSKRIFEQMRNETGGTYEGVGITISFRNDVLTIVAVREEGPAARTGVLPGDQILKINDLLADKVGLAEAMEMMRGKPGQVLKMTLRRPTNNQLLELEIVREVIRESTVVDAMLLPNRYAADRKVGYVRLTQFSEPTVREMVEALNGLEADGMEALVLDLRNNPGGLLTSAVNTCGEFVAPDTVVLTTEGRNASRNSRTYRTPPGKRHVRSYPMAILINHSSASGAEVVSGALQDLHRAIVVGETSFGKGSVQQIIPVPMSDGNAIRLTTAKYYTPSKRTIHEHGVEPNIVSTLTPQDERKLMRWFRRDALPVEDRKEIEKWEDRQLARAVDALKGALIYSDTYQALQERLEREKKPREKAPEPEPEMETQPEPVEPVAVESAAEVTDEEESAAPEATEPEPAAEPEAPATE